MARITWQNVDAPDFRAALSAQADAARLFSDAAGSIGGMFESFGAQKEGQKAKKKELASAAAMDKMLRYQDGDSWGSALEQQGLLATLGVAPEMASEELLRAAAGYGENLDQNASRDLNQSNNAFNLERARLGAQRSDLEYARSEEGRERGLEAARIVDQIADGAVSKEAAERAIRDGDYGPRMTKDLFGALNELHEATWSVSPDTTLGNDEAAAQLSQTRRTIDMQRSDLEFSAGQDSMTGLVMKAPSLYGGSGDKGKQMLDNVGAGVSEEDLELFEDSRGQGRDIYNSMVQKFNKARMGDEKVPEELIAAVMEESLEGGAWLSILKSGEQFDTSAIEEKLNKLSDPRFREEKVRQSLDYENSRARLDQDIQAMDRLESEILLLRERNGSPEEIQKRLEKISEISANYGGQSSGDPAAEQRLMGLVAGRDAVAPEGPNYPSREELARAEAAGNPNVDPRIVSGKGVLEEVNSRIGGGVDSFLSNVVAQGGDELAKVGRAAGYGVGLVAPEYGSSLLNWSDQTNARMDGIRQNGILGGQAPAASTPTPQAETPGASLPRQMSDSLVAQSSYAPADTLELVGTELDMSSQEISRAKEALSLIGDQGVPPQMKNQARAEIVKFLEQARKGASKGSPEVQALIERAEEWLNI